MIERVVAGPWNVASHISGSIAGLVDPADDDAKTLRVAVSPCTIAS
jgi:hypothetical protein